MSLNFVIAIDASEQEAPPRLMATRPAHAGAIPRLQAAGHFLPGGPMLNHADQMIGSSLMSDFAHPADLPSLSDINLYLTRHACQNTDIHPCRAAQIA